MLNSRLIFSENPDQPAAPNQEATRSSTAAPLSGGQLRDGERIASGAVGTLEEADCSLPKELLGIGGSVATHLGQREKALTFSHFLCWHKACLTLNWEGAHTVLDFT